MMIFRQPIKIEFQGKDVLPGMQEYAADILPINAFLDYDIWKVVKLYMIKFSVLWFLHLAKS
jgi:hypothetical protein